ncbi:hypothetical protein MU249_004333 [Salmonella enterica]|uniref:Uncharacterized protein n=2 Tax=Salmonella enterica TaxID=28901 RepID=A0A5U8K9A2_SALEB|nr:hypothetical protein [Salmonella enterica]EAB6034358.1 hypothetical protein [Salmonella enterica subsp. enterica serovar Java]EDV3184677.1 hypothetical protein [Salmonella enterica subsp. diarizonae]EHG9468543.1 hypothetical protein [Salmonella enterica subsp. enterica serovar Newport]HCM8928290.1 hypothetical protein [Salmonella enterica subsp. enterica serovar Paratyphi B]AXD74564.1 hypothetical protein CHC34_27545 [Salmonella enterica]
MTTKVATEHNDSTGEHKKVWGNHRMARQLGLEYSILLSPSSLSEGAMDEKSGGKVYAMAA